MKPIKIVMTAFGAYKEKEEIDFNDLNGNRLFVISGNTGAGKTTIFDAICFALYGSASGADRENSQMLRSHFATDEMHTSVDFTFQLKNRTYRVFRQLAHQKAGNKSKTGDKNELYEWTDNGFISIVDRQINTEVNQKVEELVGLTENQFKQIIMLPQGEFRKLLTSDTENKEAILRRLFETERYQAMHQNMKEKIDTKKEELNASKQRLSYYIESIENQLPKREDSAIYEVLQYDSPSALQVIKALEDEQVYFQKKNQEIEINYHQASQAYNKKQEEYRKAKTLNDKFVELDSYKKEYKEMLQQAEKFKTYETHLQQAEKANQIRPYEEQVRERQKELKDNANQLSRVQQTVQQAKQQYDEAEKQYDMLKAKETERADRQLSIKQYEEYLPIVQEIETMKKRINTEAAALKTTSQHMQKLTEEITAAQQMMKEKKETIKQQESLVDSLPEKQQKVLNLQNQYKAIKKVLDTKEAMEKTQQHMKTAEKHYKEIEIQYKEKEAIWLNHQAVVLAEQLSVGESCPVCGSDHHPYLATKTEGAVTKEALENLKQETNERFKHFTLTQSDYASSQNQYKQANEALAEENLNTAVTARTLEAVFEQGTEVRQQIEKIKNVQTTRNKEKENVEQLEQQLEKQMKEKEDLIQTYYKQHEEYTRRQAAYEEKWNRVPKELQDINELEQTINNMKKIAQEEEEAWRLAEKQLKEKEAAVTKAETTLYHTKEQQSKIQANAEQAKQTFQQELQKAQFTSAEVYEAAKMSTEEFDKRKEELMQYQKKTATLEEQIKELTTTLESKERIDVKAVENALQESKEMYERALKKWEQIKSVLKNLHQLMKDIKDTETASAALEKDVVKWIEVYDMIRGQNAKKISFERYLQIDYLDQIIYAANERFKQLMNGQFYLLRSEKQEAYGKQSGLTIDVFDGYTGQTRDVKTLSGGEKFIASLCLALGMSDVIQSHQGNISIETMFIDEGFGSLDEESLYKSIDALIEIQKTGRMIGVISHVQDLKSIFPAMLHVTKSKEGVSQTRFMVN
ncbi:MAG TPA: SMC family ATPase [Pseudogracilibacillus sp.]|nr:SMC family ATPase [Pseudogracilibacillus sp.]